MKTIAFSILNRNGIQDTIQCINSLLDSNYIYFHIYLLDNGSNNDNEFAQLKKLYQNIDKITINKSHKNLGFTGGNNYNLELVAKNKYDYICLLNNDCIAQAGAIGDIINKIESYGKPGIFGPVIRNPDKSIQSCGSIINLWAGSNPRLKTITGIYQQVDCVSGSCFIISKEVLERIGLLDNQYFAYREESDYCIRASKQDYPIISINSEGIIHKEETANNKKKPYYTYLMFRNRILFLKKHATTIEYITSWLVLCIYMMTIFPKVFGLGSSKYAWKGVRDGMQGKGGSIK